MICKHVEISDAFRSLQHPVEAVRGEAIRLARVGFTVVVTHARAGRVLLPVPAGPPALAAQGAAVRPVRVDANLIGRRRMEERVFSSLY